VIGECANGFEAVKNDCGAQAGPGVSGRADAEAGWVEVLELIDPSIAVIYVTAYDQYAMKAFDAHAVDYLLKPFSPERFKKALERRGRGWENRLRRPSNIGHGIVGGGRAPRSRSWSGLW